MFHFSPDRFWNYIPVIFVSNSLIELFFGMIDGAIAFVVC